MREDWSYVADTQRVCNAVKEKSQGDSSVLASKKLAGPWMGEAWGKFMSRNRGEEKQGDQLSKRGEERMRFDFLMRG